eukprot:2546514-Pyramimonas_sp.AAC.1
MALFLLAVFITFLLFAFFVLPAICGLVELLIADLLRRKVEGSEPLRAAVVARAVLLNVS